MKKLVFMFVAMAAMTFAACGDQAKPAAEAADTTAVEAPADTTATDTLNADSTNAEAPVDTTTTAQ